MKTPFESLSDSEWTQGPLELPAPLREALERLSEVLHASVFNGSNFHIVLERLWEAEDAATASTLTNDTREEVE